MVRYANIIIALFEKYSDQTAKLRFSILLTFIIVLGKCFTDIINQLALFNLTIYKLAAMQLVHLS